MQTSDITLIALAAVTGLLVLFQFVVLIAFFLAFRKGMAAMQEHANELRDSAVPVLKDAKELLRVTRELIARIEPRLESAATDVAEITRTARVQITRIQVSADEITERARRQAARIDGMTTSTLNGVDRVGQFIGDAINVPMRQVSGLIAGAKAIVETLRSPAPAQRRAAADARATEHKNVVA
jgi:F0F1-type ATP synthase membrane subunit b/b'